MTPPTRKTRIAHIAAMAAAVVGLGLISPAHAQDAPVSPAAAPGYLIANFDITDEVGYAAYLQAARTITPRFGGRVVVFDPATAPVEGEAGAIFVIVEFPSLADARRFYDSPDYVAARPLRQNATRGRFLILTEGPQPTPR